MQKKNRKKSFLIPILRLALFLLLIFVKVDAIDTVTVYVTSPVSDDLILPTSAISSVYLSDQMSISASPGEYEPATFVVKANSAVTDMTIAKTDLASGGNTISSSNIDIKAVKVWWQAGDPVTGISGTAQLVPELLLNNDDLVSVDATDNYLMVTDTYVKISDSTGVSGVANFPTVTDFPVQDSATLQPVDIAQDTNKQFWITVKVPDGTAAGTYSSTITLSAGGVTLKTLTLSVRVLPITLAASPMTFGLFYQGTLTTSTVGTVSYAAKNQTQFTAEMQNMVNHGYTAANIGSAQGSDALLQLALDVRSTAGMDNSNFYYVGCTVSSCSTSTMKHYADLAVPYGSTQTYVYGLDEASMVNVTSSMSNMHATGIKVFSAQYLADAQRVPDYLDTVITTGAPDAGTAGMYHNYSGKIFSYGNPGTSAEAPETHRRNYGLTLWQNDYDGAMDWAYQYSFGGNAWDDFQPANSKHTTLAYPTTDGVIDTLQWEGKREGVDDVRYITTLQNLINSPPAGKSVTSAQNYLTTLKAANISASDLDVIRSNVINYILYLLDQGSEPSSTVSPSSLTVSYATSTDFDNGYSNRLQINAKLQIESTNDVSAFIDTIGTDKTLMGYWGFNEGSGTAVYDGSGNGSTGTLEYGEYETADVGTTTDTIKETTGYSLRATNDVYNYWTLAVTSGAGAGQTSLISDYIVTSNYEKSIVLATPIAGLSSGDSYHIYANSVSSGPTWVTGKRGKAINLDGVDDYIDFGATTADTPVAAPSMTVATWIKLGGWRAGGYQFIIGKNAPYSLYLYSDKLGVNLYTAGGVWRVIGGTGSVTVNKWHHVAMTYDGTSVRIYLDGSLDTLFTPDSPYGSVSGSGACLQIGRYNNGGCAGDGGNNFQGSIDELMIWKRALSELEIKSLYNASIFPPVFSSPTLSEGAHSFHAYAIDTDGNSVWSATTTINTVVYSPNSNLNLSDLGFATSSPLKLLSGTVWDRFAAKTSSTFEVTASAGNKLDIGQGSSLLSLTPSGGEANLYFDADNYLSGGYVNQWMVSSSVESAEISTTIKKPVPANNSYTYYEIKVDGIHYADVGPDSSGNVSFTYSGGFSTKDFTIEEKSRSQGGDATSVVINGATVSLVESATTSIESTATSTPVYLSTSTLPQIPQETASTTPVLIEISTSTAETATVSPSPSPPPVIFISIPQPQAATSTATARLQDKLKEFGFMSPDIPSTGYYGSLTSQAVIAFQKSVGIEPVGHYGPLTKKALNEYSKPVKSQETIQEQPSAPPPQDSSVSSQTSVAPQTADSAEQPATKKPGFFSRIIDFFKSIGRFFRGR